MSGMVVVCGSGQESRVRKMFAPIAHRGPAISGLSEQNGICMAQNYLQADTAGARGDEPVPVKHAENGRLRVCYDGQMGNWRELARDYKVEDGPYREERILLELYKRHGREMLSSLDDAIYALVVQDGDEIFAARDPFGIKTLFYGWKDGRLCLASELKGLAETVEEAREFPPGHFMGKDGKPVCFATLPQTPPKRMHEDLDKMIEGVRGIIQKSLSERVDFSLPTASLLSGGMDSSVIAMLAARMVREKFGPEARLRTYAIGVGESEDVRSARIMAEHIGSDHQELVVTLDEVVEALPQVVYHLESFDPSLVRSAVSNYLVSGRARRDGVEVLLSGEGGDEMFCGYMYLKEVPDEELFAKQMECLSYLHNIASLRLDRMNHCHSVRVVAPLISGELFRYASCIPAEYKIKPEGGEKIEKWIFRKAFEKDLPDAIAWRLKQEFSQGSGSAALLPAYFDEAVSDEEFEEARAKYPVVRSKEELYYFRIFTEHYGDGAAVKTVGQWVSL